MSVLICIRGNQGRRGGRKLSQLSLFLGANRFKMSPLLQTLYLCNDREEAQLYALALLWDQVNFVKGSVASIVRVEELIHLMTHWFETSFANPTEKNKNLTSTWAPCELFSFCVPFLYCSVPTPFLVGRGDIYREKGCGTQGLV